MINTAGKKLHEFLPATRGPFDELRNVGRLVDCEWEDSEDFEIPLTDIEEAFAFAKTHVAAGRMVIINCAQGKSRSGTMAVLHSRQGEAACHGGPLLRQAASSLCNQTR